jgi:competence ComEA-like helix-hairpin-helix protein
MRIKSSQTFACIDETGFHSLNLRPTQTIRLLVIVFLIVGCSCARIPRHAIVIVDSYGDKPIKPQTRVNLNSASLSELQRLPGVGKVLADRIIEHRNQYGRFRRTEHLMMVRGISERKFLELQPLIMVE